MAATTDRRFTEFYRNSSVYESKQAAITGLYDHSMVNSLKDGEPVLARYMAYFKWNSNVKQYIHEETKTANVTYTFTRLVSNETTTAITRQYIVNDIINYTGEESGVVVRKSYKCIANTGSVPQSPSSPIELTNTTYFTEITSASVTPEYVQTIRVIMGIATVFDSGNPGNFKKNPPQGKLTFFEEDDVIKELINNASIESADGTIVINTTVTGKNLSVNAGSMLTVAGSGDSNPGEINVNIDDVTIKQYDSGADEDKLYVKTGNGLTVDSTDGIQVNAGAALDFSNDALDVQVDEQSIDVNNSNKLEVIHDSTLTKASHVESGATVYDGLHVNIDEQTLQQKGDNTIAVKHDTTIIEKSHIDSVSGNTVYDGISVNIDNTTIKQYPSDHATHPNELYVDPSITSVTGQDAIDVTSSVSGKVVSLDIDDTNNILAQGSYWIELTSEPSETWTDDNTFETLPTVAESDIDENGYIRVGTGPDYTYYQLSGKGLRTHLTFRSLTSAEITALSDPNVREAYKLVSSASGTETTLGDVVKIYKDSSLYNVYLGRVDDKLTNENPTTHESPDTAITYGTGADALCFIYQLADGNYKMATVNVESFLSENEFRDGLSVTGAAPHYTYDDGTNIPAGYTWVTSGEGQNSFDTEAEALEVVASSTSPLYLRYGTSPDYGYLRKETGKEVSVKVGDGIQFSSTADVDGRKFIEVNTGDGIQISQTTKAVEANVGNGIQINGTSKAIEVNISDGLTLDDGTDGEKAIIVNTGNGIQITNGAVEAKLSNGLEFTGSTDGEKSIQAKLGDGVQFGSSNEIKAKVGDGIQINSTSKAIEVKLGLGLELDNSSAIQVKTGALIEVDSTGVKHSVSGVNAGSYGSSTDIQSNSFDIPYITVDQYGHITAAANKTITVPEGTIISHTEPTWETAHVSPDLATAIANNKIEVDDTVTEAVQALDNKVAAVEVELDRAESVLSQAIEDETRYYAKDTTPGEVAVTEKSAKVVEDRNFNLINGTKVDVYFQYAQTSASGTLNINNTGAKALVYNDALFDTTLIEAGTTLSLVYDAAYNNNTGCYRVVGGVGSGSGNSGILKLTDGHATNVVNGYTEVTINTSATAYSSTWFTGITQTSGTADTTVYRVNDPTNGANYQNKAYVWNGTKYVLSDNITQSVNVDLSAYMLNETRTQLVSVDNMLEIVDMALNATVNASGTEYGANWLLDANGDVITPKTDQKYKVSNNYYTWNGTTYTSSDNAPDYRLTMTNTWDCGTY